MKRRNFLKLLGIAVSAPTALAALPEKKLTVAMLRECAKELKAVEEMEPEYPLGTRKVMADGRVFRYCQVKEKGFVKKNGQVVGIGTGDGWMQTWGVCNKMPVMMDEVVHLNISI